MAGNCPAHPNITDIEECNSGASTCQHHFSIATTGPRDYLSFDLKKNLKIVERLEVCAIAEYTKITILGAILMIYDAWTKLKQRTIFNPYKHIGFDKGHVDNTITSNADDYCSSATHNKRGVCSD